MGAESSELALFVQLMHGRCKGFPGYVPRQRDSTSLFPWREEVPRTCASLALHIAPHLKRLLLEAINRERAHVLLFDESLNAVTKNKQLDVHVRFWSNGMVVMRYLSSSFMGHGTTEYQWMVQM